MPVLMSDETLRMAKMTEQEMVVEVACLLFDAGKLATLASREDGRDGAVRFRAGTLPAEDPGLPPDGRRFRP